MGIWNDYRVQIAQAGRRRWLHCYWHDWRSREVACFHRSLEMGEGTLVDRITFCKLYLCGFASMTMVRKGIGSVLGTQ